MRYFSKVTTDEYNEFFERCNSKPLRRGVIMTISARARRSKSVIHGLDKGEFFLSKYECGKFGLKEGQAGQVYRVLQDLIQYGIIEPAGEVRTDQGIATKYRLLHNDFIRYGKDDETRTDQQQTNHGLATDGEQTNNSPATVQPQSITKNEEGIECKNEEGENVILSPYGDNGEQVAAKPPKKTSSKKSKKKTMQEVAAEIDPPPAAEKETLPAVPDDEPPTPVVYGNADVNSLIKLMQLHAQKLGIEYNTKNERFFCNHILTAKKFGDFAEKHGKTRQQMALYLMTVSIEINYRRGPTAGPMDIYSYYADIFNQRVKRSKKNIVGDAPPNVFKPI